MSMMDSLINKAKQRSDSEVKSENKKPENNSTDSNEIESYLRSKSIKVKVVGSGGAGNNTLNRLSEMDIAHDNVSLVAMNTDAQDLLKTLHTRKILLGKELTKGLGAGSNPDIGKEAAKESFSNLKKLFVGTDLVFLTCGLGGGTGTGSAPVIAKAATEAGALVIAITTIPFSVEGRKRIKNAVSGLKELEKEVDSLILIPNDKLLEVAPNIPLTSAFKLADEIIANALKGTIDLILSPGLVNLDFADMKTVMKNSGLAMIGVGESDTKNRAQESIIDAINNPLLDVDISGAKGALINITGDDKLNLNEATKIVEYVSDKLNEDANVIWGAKIDSDLKDKISVMVIVTGINPAYLEQFKSMEDELNKEREDLTIEFVED